MFPKSHWTTWAQEWGFSHRPQKGKLYRDEWIAGLRDGLLVRVGWGGEKGVMLMVSIRFPEGQDLERVRAALAADATLDALPGKGAKRQSMHVVQPGKRRLNLGGVPEFVLADGELLWTRSFGWNNPKPEQVREWVTYLMGAVSRAGLRFDGRCEKCRQRDASGYVLVDERPALLCSSCQQELTAQGELAERSYEMLEAHHARGLLFGLGGAVVGGSAWAALAIASNRMFAVLGIGIGVLVAWCYQRGAGKVDGLGRFVVAAITVVSVALGEVLFVTWVVARARPDIGFDPLVGLQASIAIFSKEPRDAIFALACGLLGAWVAASAMKKPKLAPTVEQPGLRNAA